MIDTATPPPSASPDTSNMPADVALLAAQVDEVAENYYMQQATTALTAARTAESIWRSRTGSALDLTDWPLLLARLMDVITRGQMTNAAAATPYLVAMGKVQDFTVPDAVDAAAFTTPSDVSAQMLSRIPDRARILTLAGAPTNVIDMSTTSMVTRTVGNLVAGSGRSAASAQIAATPAIQGYVRKLHLPSCKRCAVLAGATYRWNAGFKRHPGCDCTHTPISEALHDFRDDMTVDSDAAIHAGQVTGLSKADHEAITVHGADSNQVINASRGMHTETVFGHRVKTTTEGTTKRGVYGGQFSGKDLQKTAASRYRRARAPRLTPAEILKQADGNRDEARRLLVRNRYIIQ